MGVKKTTKNQFASVCARKHAKPHFVGLGPGSFIQYSMHWLRQMLAHWTRTVHCFGEDATPARPRPARGPRWRLPAGGSFFLDLASLELKNTLILGHVSKALGGNRLTMANMRNTDIVQDGTGGGSADPNPSVAEAASSIVLTVSLPLSPMCTLAPPRNPENLQVYDCLLYTSDAADE